MKVAAFILTLFLCALIYTGVELANRPVGAGPLAMNKLSKKKVAKKSKKKAVAKNKAKSKLSKRTIAAKKRKMIGRAPASVDPSFIDRHRPIGRAHFILYCTQCHTELAQPMSTKQGFQSFLEGMGPIALHAMQTGRMPKYEKGKLMPSEKTRQDMIRFLEKEVEKNRHVEEPVARATGSRSAKRPRNH